MNGRLDTPDAPAAIPSHMFRFSLDDLPERERAPMMLDYFGRHMRRIEVVPVDREDPLRCSAEVRLLAGASWGIAQMSHVTAHRTKSLLSDGCDDIMLFAPTSGITVEPDSGAPIEVGPGSVLMMSQARAATTRYHGPAETFAFRFPHAILKTLLPGLEEAPCVEIPKQTPGLDLLFDYGRLLHRTPLTERGQQEEVVRHLQQLAALVIGASGEVALHLNKTGAAMARLTTIRSAVRKDIGHADVSAQVVARRHGITPRYLHMLFEGTGQTFSEFVTAERLAKAHVMLADPRRSNGRISDIAFALGFGDLSTFNRQFKRQYGMTPSDLRAASQRD